MKKYLSYTAALMACVTILVGENTEVQTIVDASQNPDLIKFLAPIIAGLLGKLIDKWFEKRKERKG